MRVNIYSQELTEEVKYVSSRHRSSSRSISTGACIARRCGACETDRTSGDCGDDQTELRGLVLCPRGPTEPGEDDRRPPLGRRRARLRCGGRALE